MPQIEIDKKEAGFLVDAINKMQIGVNIEDALKGLKVSDFIVNIINKLQTIMNDEQKVDEQGAQTEQPTGQEVAPTPPVEPTV